VFGNLGAGFQMLQPGFVLVKPAVDGAEALIHLVQYLVKTTVDRLKLEVNLAEMLADALKLIVDALELIADALEMLVDALELIAGMGKLLTGGCPI
jgi:hypothetical protein